MDKPSKGEHFASSPNCIPPHLRKKANLAPLQSPLPTPAAAIAQDGGHGSATVRLDPSIEGTSRGLPGSSPARGLPIVTTAATKTEHIEEDSFGRLSPSLEASIHAPQPALQSMEALPAAASLSGDSSNKPNSSLLPVRRYQFEDLIDIAKQCSGRLPPASAVQAMFLYEMQRETESERLFEGQMFRLAKQEEELVAQARRNGEIEARMIKLEKQVSKKDALARIAANDFRVNMQQQKLADQAAQLQMAEEALASILERLETLKQTHEKFAAATEAALRDVVYQASCAARIVVASQKSEPDTSDVKIMKAELDVLFNDRDGILIKLDEVQERMKTLATNIHQLTVQKTTSQAASPAPGQHILAASLHGDLVDVTVPKSKPAVGLYGSQHAVVKDFIPYKAWSD